MTHYERLKRKRLSDLIVDEGLAEKDVVISALHEHQQTGQLLSSILLDTEAVDQYDLARVVTEQFQVPFVDLENYSVHKDLIQEFSAEVLHRARVVPLQRFGKFVCFACQEIPSPATYKALRENCEGIFVFSALAREIVTKLQDNHPWSDPRKLDPINLKTPVTPDGDMTADSSWESLFDAANESVMSDLGPDDE
ncbi:MAG: GspE/PulE/PilB domain-containing protein [Planctomycetota bacterium]|jgi:hypothetical protein